MKDMNKLTDEEIQEQISNLDQEITKFNQETIPKILEILEQEEHGVVVSCYGLIAIVNALLAKFGTKELLDECVFYLKNNLDDITEVEN